MLGGIKHYTVDEDNVQPLAQCDRCHFIYNRDQLDRQMEWAGLSLIDTGLLVCPRCLDTPDEQKRTIVLKPDPEPVIDARPDTMTED